MGLHPQLGAFNERHKRRLYFIKEIGCLACWLQFGEASPGGDGHHAEDENGVVIGHHALLCLCPWHHVGKTPQGFNSRSALAHYGPSRHGHTVAFTARFGTDVVLLKLQNEKLESYLSNFVIRPVL